MLGCYENFKIAAFFALSREEEFSALPSKNKVADENTPSQRRQQKNEHPNNHLVLLAFSGPNIINKSFQRSELSKAFLKIMLLTKQKMIKIF